MACNFEALQNIIPIAITGFQQVQTHLLEIRSTCRIANSGSIACHYHLDHKAQPGPSGEGVVTQPNHAGSFIRNLHASFPIWEDFRTQTFTPGPLHFQTTGQHASIVQISYSHSNLETIPICDIAYLLIHFALFPFVIVPIFQTVPPPPSFFALRQSGLDGDCPLQTTHFGTVQVGVSSTFHLSSPQLA